MNTYKQREQLQKELKKAFKSLPAFATELGLEPTRSFEVHALRSAMRVAPDGRFTPQVVLALTQSTMIDADPATGTPAHKFRSGSTLVIDLVASEIKYRIVKNVASVHRRARTAAFVRQYDADPLQSLFLSQEAIEPFAALHALADEGL